MIPSLLENYRQSQKLHRGHLLGFPTPNPQNLSLQNPDLGEQVYKPFPASLLGVLQ